MGLAALPAHGVVAVGMRAEDEVRVLRASDGQCVSVYRTTGNVLTLAADAESGVVCFAVNHEGVLVCAWDGRELQLRTRVTCAFGNTGAFGVLLAVMPRSIAVGGRWGGCPHLIVGWAEGGGPVGRGAAVFALRDQPPFVGEATMADLPRVVLREGEGGSFDYAPGAGGLHSLAADPAGTALVVCDRSSHAAVVLPWPLPGLPD